MVVDIQKKVFAPGILAFAVSSAIAKYKSHFLHGATRDFVILVDAGLDFVLVHIGPTSYGAHGPGCIGLPPGGLHVFPVTRGGAGIGDYAGVDVYGAATIFEATGALGCVEIHGNGLVGTWEKWLGPDGLGKTRLGQDTAQDCQ